MKSILARASWQCRNCTQPMQRLRLLHSSAPISAVLGRIQQVMDQSRPVQKPKNQGVSSSENTANPGDPPAPAPADSDAKSPDTKHKNSAYLKYKAREKQRAQQAAHFDMPYEYWPADPVLSMPKVFGTFEQPPDAQIAKIVMIGAANAGKSTLVNRLTGAEVSIVSRQPQTTRTRIMASSTVGNKQLIFLDTPGIVSRAGIRRIARGTVTAPWLTLSEASCVLLLLDAYKITEKTTYVEDGIFDSLSRLPPKPALMVINKMDLITDRTKVERAVAEYRARYSGIISDPIYISAIDNVGVEAVKAQLLEQTRPGDWEVPANVTNDMSDLMRVEELIRAEWFERMSSYLPYVIKQRNVGWEETSVMYNRHVKIDEEYPSHVVYDEKQDSLLAACEHSAKKQTTILRNQKDIGLQQPPQMRRVLVIHQQLLVQSGGQAKILIGENGKLIKEISRVAAGKISKALNRHVRLHLRVMVEKDTRTSK
ncbi:hypothetical protein IWW40_001514 [Coemansia sp. RSA 1250]|nr:hypothetical protein IWW40_001514 [Coemansia sp. RSA 1250]